MTDARAALAEATARFAFSATPRLDAELLLAHAHGIERDELLLRLRDLAVPPHFADLVARRERHEPVAYITGGRGFWTIDLHVGPGALVPRADSETLIEAALARFAGRPPRTVLDLGTGPGTLLLALLHEWRNAAGIGVDRSATALGYALENARRTGSSERARFVQGDWAGTLIGPFDLVIANPPYVATGEMLPAEVVRYEPAAALFAGPDGLDEYRRLAPDLRRLMQSGGAAILEVGSTQGAAVGDLLRAQGFAVAEHLDLGGCVRALVAT